MNLEGPNDSRPTKNTTLLPKKTIYFTGSVVVTVLTTLLILVQFSHSMRRAFYEKTVRGGWESSLAQDLVEDVISLEAKVSLRPLVFRERKADTKKPSPQIKMASVTVPARKRSPQHLSSQVLRIITDANRRQTQGKRLASAIVAESVRQNYDPLFVAAVIKSESAFNEMAVSNKGARGLMQIMPATGKYLAELNNVAWPAPAKLSDAGFNLQLGVSYLKQLEQMYHGNRLLTLIAYNWGPGKLDRAIKSGRGVPAECLRYALKILKDHHLWEANAPVSMG